WGTAEVAEIPRHAAELAALAPDVILAYGSSAVGTLLQATSTVPIVFPAAVDPVGAGFVDSLSRPGGNATGFSGLEYSLGGKWARRTDGRHPAPALAGPRLVLRPGHSADQVLHKSLALPVTGSCPRR